MLERTPSGNEVVTTVFPVYAEGTDEFVVLEARHSIAGRIVLGQDSYGTLQGPDSRETVKGTCR